MLLLEGCTSSIAAVSSLELYPFSINTWKAGPNASRKAVLLLANSSTMLAVSEGGQSLMLALQVALTSVPLLSGCMNFHIAYYSYSKENIEIFITIVHKKEYMPYPIMRRETAVYKTHSDVTIMLSFTKYSFHGVTNQRMIRCVN